VESLASFVHVRGALLLFWGNGGFLLLLEKRKNFLVFIKSIGSFLSLYVVVNSFVMCFRKRKWLNFKI